MVVGQVTPERLCVPGDHYRRDHTPCVRGQLNAQENKKVLGQSTTS